MRSDGERIHPMVAHDLHQRPANRMLEGWEHQACRRIQPADRRALDQEDSFFNMIDDGGLLASVAGVKRCGRCRRLDAAPGAALKPPSPEPCHPGRNLADMIPIHEERPLLQGENLRAAGESRRTLPGYAAQVKIRPEAG